MGSSLSNKPHAQYNKYENPDIKHLNEFTGPFIHPSVKDFSDLEIAYKDRTLIGNNIEKMIKFKDRDCIGFRKQTGPNSYEKHYTFFKYGEIHKLSVNFAKNVHTKDLLHYDSDNGKDFKLIGLFAQNSIEWVVSDMGCQMDSITTVTLYSTLGLEAFKFICDESKIKTVCVSCDLVQALVDNIKNWNISTIKNVILFDMTNPNQDKIDASLKSLQSVGLEVYRFTDFIKDNNEVKETDLVMSKADTVLTICYTSGTTGQPKGVMIIQRNMISVLEICVRDSGIEFNENSSHISFLPWAHIMERVIICGFMSTAGKIGFVSGSVKTTLMEDISILKPTILIVVPKVLQTLRAKILDQFSKLKGFKKQLAFRAWETKRANFEQYGVITHAVYDKIVFNQIRKGFGGEWKVILCSSAPLAKELADEIKWLLSVPICEGWGMTELTGPAFSTKFTDLTNNTAGGVISISHWKLRDVPELGYTYNTIINGVHCPSGEMCVKGPAVCAGYYKNLEETNKTIDKEGYLHTGDIGCWTNMGNGIKVIDRVKEIFKLSQGEYIIPAKWESVYIKSRYVNQILIYGNSLKNNIIAIISGNKVICKSFLCTLLNSPNQEFKDSEIEKNLELKEEIKHDLALLAKEGRLNSLEKVNYFHLTMEEFNVDNGCMTPTMKMVRKKIEERYKSEIDAIYHDIKN